MLIPFEHILASGSGGIVFMILLLIFWGINALGSIAKKQKERDRQMLEAMRNAPQQVPARPAPPLLRPPKAVPKFPGRQQLSKLASRAPVKINRPVTQKRGIPRSPQRVPPRPPVAPAATAARTDAAPAAPIAQAAPRAATPAPRAPAPPASARSVAHWLRPGTLRSQFILTEVFQPPLALREPSEIL